MKTMPIKGTPVTRALFWISILILLHFSLLADHLPENQIAAGKSEEILASVNVYHSTIRQVMSKFGAPGHIVNLKEEGNVAGGKNYEWNRDGVKLLLGTWNDKGNESIPYSVEVWGNKPSGPIGVTGRGLKLGTSLSEIRRIYGNRFRKSRGDNGTLQVTVQWQDETTLYLSFNSSEKLNYMHLMASTE